MNLESIVTLADAKSELGFRVLERSLRATGCQTPLRVIPFSDRLFSLPRNSYWWNEPVDWILRHFKDKIRHPFQRRYFLLRCQNYQVADTDVVFLENPEEILKPHQGFVVACCQWHVPEYGAPQYTIDKLKQLSSTWQSRLFNAGQFACGSALYEEGELKQAMSGRDADLHVFANDPPWDQGGFNYLVALKQPIYRNLTFPPGKMESTWAGDYPGKYEHLWSAAGCRPYLIHWAGSYLDHNLPINELFFQFMTREERAAWTISHRQRLQAAEKKYWKRLGRLRNKFKRLLF